MREATNSPIDDLTYDVITVLQNKAKALEAYDKYIRDAGDDAEARAIFAEMREQDAAHVRVLKEVLARRLEEDLDLEEDDEDYDDEIYDEDDDEAEVEDPGGSVSSEETGEPPRRGESTQRRV